LKSRSWNKRDKSKDENYNQRKKKNFEYAVEKEYGICTGGQSTPTAVRATSRDDKEKSSVSVT